MRINYFDVYVTNQGSYVCNICLESAGAKGPGNKVLRHLQKHQNVHASLVKLSDVELIRQFKIKEATGTTLKTAAESE